MMRSTAFDMGSVLNKLRSIEEGGVENVTAIDKDNYSKVLTRLNGLRAAIPPAEFTLIKNGIVALSANKRPNMAQMSALNNLLEIVLMYVADDSTLFQRLKSDFLGQSGTDEAPADFTDAEEVATDEEPEELEDQAEDEDDAPAIAAKLRDLK
jgi:sulfur relay (sulfurtransferase) DsrF/TusC family protein